MRTTSPDLRPAPATWTRGDIELAHPRPFVCTLVVDDAQINETIPHVTNIEYVRWLDRAAELHGDAVGCSRDRLLADGRMWFVGRHEIDYLAECWPDDRLWIATWVRDIRRVRSWRDTVVVRPADRTVVCRASTLWVLVDLDTRKPIRVPDAMIDAFDPLLS